MSPLRILYVAYPMLAVSRESCGGAEQMLWVLEKEMARRGHYTTVAACDGSQIAGWLFATGAAPRHLDSFEQRNAEHSAQILRLLSATRRSSSRFDLVHDKSGSFWRNATELGAPVLATLHLPRSFYPAEAFEKLPKSLFFNCVSHSQRRSFPDLPNMLGVVGNGIRVADFPPPVAPLLSHLGLVRQGGGVRDDSLLWMGRICEEKGTHVAIEVARRAGRKLIIAGDVYPFSYHRRYFDCKIRPQLDGARVRHVGVPKFTDKIDLLRRARALLLPSLVDETSSLVAMEAMACGTPVVAFRRGAIPEIVRHGITGFVVDSPEEMALAIHRAGEIDPLACRAHVEANFTAQHMAADYEQLYCHVLRDAADSRQTSRAA